MKTILSIRRLLAPAAALAMMALLPGSASAAEKSYTLGWGGDSVSRQLDIPAAAFSNASQIVAAPGAYHSFALVNGRVLGWGVSDSGALDNIPSLQNISFVAAGDTAGLAITDRGDAFLWGARNNAIFRDNCPAKSFYVSAALGSDHGLLLTDGGSVEAWGAPAANEPVTVPNSAWNSGFTAVAAGRNFSVGLSNGIVHVAAPANDPYHVLEIPEAATRFAPGTRQGIVTAIAAGPFHAMALTQDGEVLVWGAWCEDEDAAPSSSSRKAPVPRNSFGNVTNVPPAATSGIQAIAAGYNVCAALTTNRGVLIWGSDAGTGSVLSDIPAFASRDVREIALGRQHAIVRSAWLPPEFLDTPLPEAHLESEYSAVVPVRADPAAVVTAPNPGLLPAGIVLSANGVLSGIPTEKGTNTFPVVASNAYGSVRQNFTIVVSDRNVTAPVWITGADDLPPAVAGFPFGYQLGNPWFDLEATESPTYSAVAQVPAWLSLDPATGRLTGTPAASDVGTFYPSFSAANSALPDGTNRMFQLVVSAPSADTPPVIGRDSIPDLRVGSAVSIDLQIWGATKVILSGKLASGSGLSVVSSNGTWYLTGTPKAAVQGENIPASLEAANAGATATADYLVNVRGGPRWVTTSLPTAVIDKPYEATLVANWATSYEIPDSALRPIRLALSVATNDTGVVAVLSGTPTNKVTTTFSIPVTAKNAYDSATQTFVLTLSSTPVATPDYRFLSIAPSAKDSTVTLVWTNRASPDLSAVLVSTTNLIQGFPAATAGTLLTSPATLALPASPTYYRLLPP